MRSLPNDDTELVFGAAPVATQPPSIDPAALRRAMKYGQKARSQFRGRLFRDVEADLQAGWLLRGEVTEWDWVRAAVRAGFELEPQDEV